MSDEFKQFLDKHMFIGVPQSGDAGDKFALIGMVCYLTRALQQQKPGMTHYQVIRMCTKNKAFSAEVIESLANVCDWFAYNCVKFPDFGVKPKEMPSKICDLIEQLLPF